MFPEPDKLGMTREPLEQGIVELTRFFRTGSHVIVSVRHGVPQVYQELFAALFRILYAPDCIEGGC